MNDDEFSVAMINEYSVGFLRCAAENDLREGMKMSFFLGIALGHHNVQLRQKQKAGMSRRGSFTRDVGSSDRIRKAMKQLAARPEHSGKRITARILKTHEEFRNCP